MTTTRAQETAHKLNVSAAEGSKQTAQAAAYLAYGNVPGAFPTLAAAIKAADVAYVRALIASATANGLEGPRETLRELTGSAA